MSVGKFDERHGAIGARDVRSVRRDHLDTDVGAPTRLQQVRTLVPHHGCASHHVAQTALVQQGHVQWAALRQEALLSAQSGANALLDLRPAHDLREQRRRIIGRLQKARDDPLLIFMQGHRHRIHLSPALEPVRMLHLRIPIDPPPQPQQHPTRTEDFVAGVGEGVLRYPDARLDACHLGAVARDLAGQGFLGEPGRLPVMLQHLAEHSGRRGRRSPRGIASVHESPFVTVGNCHALSVVTVGLARQR